MSKTIKCEPGCEGKILPSGYYCQCLEAKLPKPSGRSVKLYTQGLSIESAATVNSAYPLYKSTTEPRIANLIDQLYRYGLEEFEVELIIARFIEEKTLREIRTELGWTSHSSIDHHLKQTLKKLKKRGFTLDI